MGAETQVAAVFQKHNRIIGLAELACAFDNGFENRPNICRRGCDHAKDIAAAGLVSQCLGQVARLCLHLCVPKTLSALMKLSWRNDRATLFCGLDPAKMVVNFPDTGNMARKSESSAYVRQIIH